MKHHTSTAFTFVPRLLPESSLPERMQAVQNMVASRAYELFAARGFTDGHDLEDWLSAESEFLQQVPLQVSEREKDLTVNTELPGFTTKDIEVRVEPRRLFISGQREEKSEDKKKGEVVSSECRSSQVFRAIDLPAEVDPDKVTATFDRGKLEITLPKSEIGKKAATEEKAA